MNQEQEAFAGSARELAAMLQVTCTAMGLNKHQTATLLCAATGQALSTMFDPVEAVERLRDAADLIERSVLGGLAR